MPDFSRRDVLKQGLGALLSPKAAVKAVNTAMKSIPNVSKIDLKRYGIDLAGLMSAVIDGDSDGDFETNEDRSITLENGKTIPGEAVAAIIKDGLKDLPLEDLIEHITSYMSSAEYDSEYGVFSDIVQQTVDRVGLKTFVRAVIAADGYGQSGIPSIEDSGFERLQDLLINITKGELFPGSHSFIFHGGSSYADQVHDMVDVLRKQGFLKPVEAAKILRNHQAKFERTAEWEKEMKVRQDQDSYDKNLKQSDPDWYYDSPDPFYHTKERFHEHKIQTSRYFTESYRRLARGS